MLTPDIYDPTLNSLYRDVLTHYGVVALPCRVGDPDRKGKVESAIEAVLSREVSGLAEGAIALGLRDMLILPRRSAER